MTFFSRKPSEAGFTLIEMMIVIAILAVIATITAPRISAVINPSKSNFMLASAMISKTFDDSFLKGRTNFLAIHLDREDADQQNDELNRRIYERSNGFSVLRLNRDGTFTDSDNPMLRHRTFSIGFDLEEVILANGTIIKQGTVLVPFHPEGMADDVIIHIRSGDEMRSLIISRMRKFPRIAAGYVTFENMWDENAF